MISERFTLLNREGPKETDSFFKARGHSAKPKRAERAPGDQEARHRSFPTTDVLCLVEPFLDVLHHSLSVGDDKFEECCGRGQ